MPRSSIAADLHDLLCLQGSSSGPVPQASIQELLVADYAPEWDFTTGSGKLLISGSFEGICEPLFVLLDGVRVSALMVLCLGCWMASSRLLPLGPSSCAAGWHWGLLL